MTCRPSPFKSGHIGIKDAQCAQTYDKQFPDYYFLRYGRFCTQDSYKSDQNVTINDQTIEFCSNFARDYIKIRFRRFQEN